MELSKMFGVERGEIFRVNGFNLEFMIDYNTHNYEYIKCRIIGSTLFENIVSDTLFRVIAAAPAGIIHLHPPLTDEQREQLKALYTIGYRYLTRTISITIVAHVVKPRQVMNEWIQGGLHAYIPYENSSVYRLPIKNDSEPFDIGKALGVGE